MGRKLGLVVLGANDGLVRELEQTLDLYGLNYTDEDAEDMDLPVIVAYGERAVAVARMNYAQRYPENVLADQMEDWQSQFNLLFGSEHLVPMPELGCHGLAPVDLTQSTAIRFMEMH